MMERGTREAAEEGRKWGEEGEREAKSQSIAAGALFARGLTLIPICRSD